MLSLAVNTFIALYTVIGVSDQFIYYLTRLLVSPSTFWELNMYILTIWDQGIVTISQLLSAAQVIDFSDPEEQVYTRHGSPWLTHSAIQQIQHTR